MKALPLEAELLRTDKHHETCSHCAQFCEST